MNQGTLGQATNIARPDNEADLICEALVREIGRDTRWMAKVAAWQALLSVRRQSEGMESERRHLAGSASGAGTNVGNQARI